MLWQCIHEKILFYSLIYMYECLCLSLRQIEVIKAIKVIKVDGFTTEKVIGLVLRLI